MQVIISKLKEVSYARTTYRLNATSEQKLEDFQDPISWSSCTNILKRGDKIEIWAEDGTWYAEGIVSSVKTASVHIQFYTVAEFDKEDVEPDKPYYIKHRGRGGWAVIRRADNELIETGIQEKREAKEKCDKFNLTGE